MPRYHYEDPNWLKQLVEDSMALKYTDFGEPGSWQKHNDRILPFISPSDGARVKELMSRKGEYCTYWIALSAIMNDLRN